MEKEKDNWVFLPFLAGDDWNCSERAGNEETDHPHG